MKNYEMIIEMVGRANNEILAHRKEKSQHSYWYSGHKNKAKRAIVLARELLLEAAKELDELDKC